MFYLVISLCSLTCCRIRGTLVPGILLWSCSSSVERETPNKPDSTEDKTIQSQPVSDSVLMRSHTITLIIIKTNERSDSKCSFYKRLCERVSPACTRVNKIDVKCLAQCKKNIQRTQRSESIFRSSLLMLNTYQRH